jgi:Ca-activated chloride channel family protein
MRSMLRIALLFLALAAARPAMSQDAADYFHGAAYKFVAGRHQEASVEAEEGLRKFPGDAKLKTLADHIRRMKNQQRQDQGQSGQEKSDQGKEDKDQEGSQGDKGEQDKKEEEKDKQEGPEDEKGKDGEEAPQDQSDDQGGKDSTGEAQAPVKPGEMSKEDAERLLNSIQDDEKKEHKQQQRRFRKKVEVEQDW